MENFTIDRKNKSFVFDDGEVIPIPKNQQRAVLRSKAGKQSKEEAIEKWKQWQERVPIGEEAHTLIGSTSENLFGNLGDTLANYVVAGKKSLKKGEGQEEMGYIDRVLDHFYGMQEGRKEYLSGLEKENPSSAKAGKVLGVVGELGSLYGVPGKYALPAMGAGSSETSFLEPAEKSKEVGKDVIVGGILDKFFGGLSNVAGHRESQRGLKNLVSSTEQANAAEVQRASKATQADKSRFSTETAARDAEVANLPNIQAVENKAFQDATNKSINRISQTINKQPVAADVLGVEDFINSSINKSANAATSEANYAGRFLKTVFKGDKNGKITGESLKKGMQALDEAILKNEGATRQILMDYKNFVAKSLPERLTSSYVFEKWAPRLIKSAEGLENNLQTVLKSSKEINETLSKRLGKDYARTLNAEIKKSITDILRSNKNNFSVMDSGILKQEIEGAIKASPAYQKMMGKVEGLFPQLSREQAFNAFPQFRSIYSSLESYPEMLADKLSKNFEKISNDIATDFITKGGITQEAAQKIPLGPNIIPPPPPVAGAQTIQPNLQSIPQIPKPQDMYGKLAQGLEYIKDSGAKTAVSALKRNAPAAFLAKAAGVPIGKAALAAGAAATGARALTSPSAGGKLLRTGLEQGSRGVLGVVDDLAQQYPSYHDGVLEDPQERRSLTKEIENLNDLTIEQKSVFQSKVNRGKPLQDRLQ